MNHDDYSKLINQIRHGKKLPDALYLHKSLLSEKYESIFKVIQNIADALKIHGDWDVVKLFRKEFKVSLLSYPEFFSNSYPPLVKSTLVDLEKLTSRTTSYQKSENPPILHRKELMVSENHKQYEEFCQITKEGEMIGLYENPFKIGFKETWERLIQQKGYELIDGHLKQLSERVLDTEEHKVDRHLTAIIRYELSTPFKILAKHGFLKPEYSIFDYGCGRGDDLRELQAHGLSASGWDPNFRPDDEIFNADLVNIGFVINVIENIDERIEALQKAYSLSRKLTVVSAMIAGESVISKFKPYKDGVLTSKNTFQKYYTQAELKGFIERTLDTEAIAAAPGVFFVFKDKIAEQEFLLNRNKRNITWNHITQDVERVGRNELIYVKHKQLLDQFWECCLAYGRLPVETEFESIEELQNTIGSTKKALKVLDSIADITDLQLAAAMRKEDLTLYFALGLFSKRKPYKSLPESLQADIKTFFGNYKEANESAKEALFSIANTEIISEECSNASEILSACDFRPNRHLIFHKKFLDVLPLTLRIYVNCAIQLYGDLESVNLIKIHIHSGKVSFMVYDEFESSPLPLLIERIKVNLRKQDVDFFDYVPPFTPPALYWKSKFIDDSFEDFKKQRSFDKKLVELGIMEFTKDYGPTREELMISIENMGFDLRGYRFYKR